MDDERKPARKSDYFVARLAAAGILILVLSAILLIDAVRTDYDASPVIVYGLLGSICALLGRDIFDLPDIFDRGGGR